MKLAESTEGICRMKKSKLYTKGGDKGETSLVSGTRLSKSSKRISLYGEVDELNSALGMSIALLEESNENFSLIESELMEIQSNLFNIGSRLACETDAWDKYKLPEVRSEALGNIEVLIDQLDSELPELKEFILPGGSKAAAYLHVTRTICRRVERQLVEFLKEDELPAGSLQLMNRLSDLLFVSARYVNHKLEVIDIPWKA